MPPQPGVGVKPVVDEEPVAMAGHKGDRPDDVLEDSLVNEVVEVDPHPPWLNSFTAGGDGAFVLVRALDVDAEQSMPVRPGARAPSSRLNTEQVIEQRDYRVVMQIATASAPYDEGHDRQSFCVEVAQDLDLGYRAPRTDCSADVVSLVGVDDCGAYGILELEDHAGTNRLDDGRRSCFFAVHRLVEIDVL